MTAAPAPQAASPARHPADLTEAKPAVDPLPVPKPVGQAGGDPWARALEGAGSKQLRALMGSLRPLEVSSTRILVVADHGMRKMVEGRLGEIEDIVRRASGARLELAPAPGGSAGAAASAEPAPGPQARQPAGAEPEIVRLAAELFGARVVNVQRKDRSDGQG